jgi:hypothetical protein
MENHSMNELWQEMNEKREIVERLAPELLEGYDNLMDAINDRFVGEIIEH